MSQEETKPPDAAEYVVIKEIHKVKDWQSKTKTIKSSWNSIPHYMARPITAFTIESKYYIMYECSLQDYWELSPRKNPSVEVMREFLTQLLELVQNLKDMPLTVISSDLYEDSKPENILKFPARSSSR